MTRVPKKPISLQRLDIKVLIAEVCEQFADVFHECEVQVDVDVPENLWVQIDPLLMREAFRKLIDNALEAMPGGGQITVTSLVGRGGLEIEIADTGPGIDDSLLNKVFDPFVTNKTDHAGLGLSMVREIAEAHQGTVSVMDCPDGGAAFTLAIPLQVVRKAA